jgi:hypothetical protein
MIKFFRQIRQRLLTQNKISRYLLYAIGEIVLVVIGILIALQINNWNDQKRDAALEFTYYNRILEDFELDRKLIDELLAKAGERIEKSKEILLELHSGTRNRNYILNQFLLAIRGDAYVPRNAAYRDMVSSGNLKLLKDVTLKNSLIQFYSELENRVSQLEQNRSEKIQQSFKLVNSSVDFGIHEFDYVGQLLGPEIIDILPKNDWTKEKNSTYYQRFQMMVLFNIAMSDRQRQHLLAIRELMEEPYALLVAKSKLP